MNTVVDCILFSYQISSVANCYKLTILSNKWHSLKNYCSKQSQESRKLDIYLFFYSMNLYIMKIDISLYINIQRLSAQMSYFLHFSQCWHICDGSPVDLFIVSRVAIIKKLIKVGGAGPLTAGCSAVWLSRHVTRDTKHVTVCNANRENE